MSEWLTLTVCVSVCVHTLERGHSYAEDVLSGPHTFTLSFGMFRLRCRAGWGEGCDTSLFSPLHVCLSSRRLVSIFSHLCLISALFPFISFVSLEQPPRPALMTYRDVSWGHTSIKRRDQVSQTTSESPCSQTCGHVCVFAHSTDTVVCTLLWVTDCLNV